MIKTSPLVTIDPYLKPFASPLEKRKQRAFLRELEFTDGKKQLKDCMNNHLYYGLHKTESGWIFREKAPAARRIFLYGDFSAWQLEEQYELKSLNNGDWQIELPLETLQNGMLYKLWMFGENGGDERLPAYCRRVVQDTDSKIFSAQVWDTPPYCWQHAAPPKSAHYFIYEAHIGMSSDKPEVASYSYFREFVLPRIEKLGYNAIQLMAIQEHPYYGSFGYQVANFFAPSSRFGTPEELKALIDDAHGRGIAVILDIVHSHSVSNAKEGIGFFDGSDHLYCHSGSKGYHPVWDSRCFNYGKPETIAFLLSNIKYWLEEFHFDGLRFDGVTSMSYWDHGIGVDFLSYEQYFNKNVDEDALNYLTLANKLIKQTGAEKFTIAEDVSGIPGLAFPVEQGGIGFDYRMSMGIADFWTKIIKKVSDEKWNTGEIFFRLTDKRPEEHTIGYAESHDQAMVGDKTIIFQLIDKEMYTAMSINHSNLLVDRGIALHKIIRFLTVGLADGGYLNFMGNEFGHPEWIDFPREGNQWSYQHARRRWDLADNPLLKYKGLQDFDEDLIRLFRNHDILSENIMHHFEHQQNQILVFGRGNYLFVVNLNPVHSFTDYEIPAPAGKYTIVLNSDNPRYRGFNLIDENTSYFTIPQLNKHILKIYLPARTALAFMLNDIE